MPVHVDNVDSAVEVSGVAAAGAGTAPSGRDRPITPTWDERARHRGLDSLAERDAARLSGEGFGA